MNKTIQTTKDTFTGENFFKCTYGCHKTLASAKGAKMVQYEDEARTVAPTCAECLKLQSEQIERGHLLIVCDLES